MNETHVFSVASEQKYIRFAPCERDLWGNSHRDNTENSINIIELSYRQEDKEGWGAGGGEYITTQDIATISKGVQQIIKKEVDNFSYACLDEIIKINVNVKDGDLLTFSVSMRETLCGEYFIVITLSDLTFEKFKEITGFFTEWERTFPTLEQAWLALYHETYDKIFQYDCTNRSRCEADFNTRVTDLLENNPHGLGSFFKSLIDVYERKSRCCTGFGV
jgi:hypothetical protein